MINGGQPWLPPLIVNSNDACNANMVGRQNWSTCHDMATGAASPPTTTTRRLQDATTVPKKASTEPNVLNVVLGIIQIKPWYPSSYPEDLVGRKAERLYVCESCFRYSKELMPYLAHRVSRDSSTRHGEPWLTLHLKESLSTPRVIAARHTDISNRRPIHLRG
jgi:hypothetical protein